jgi:hypothetical protein
VRRFLALGVLPADKGVEGIWVRGHILVNFVRSRVVLLVAVMIVGSSTGSFADDLDRIVGAWNYTALAFCDSSSCDTGMFSFNAGGTVVGYDNLTGVSPNIGTWRPLGHSKYRLKTKNAIFSADGSVNVYIVSVGTVTLSDDGNTFNFQGTVKVLNPDGSLRFEAPGPISAVRF